MPLSLTDLVGMATVRVEHVTNRTMRCSKSASAAGAVAAAVSAVLVAPARTAVSNGCLHPSEVNLRWLLRRVPLGTQVVIQP